jgi:hypothetical protein
MDGPCKLDLHYFSKLDAEEQMASRTTVSSGGDMNRTIRWQYPSAGSSCAHLARPHTAYPSICFHQKGIFRLIEYDSYCHMICFLHGCWMSGIFFKFMFFLHIFFEMKSKALSCPLIKKKGTQFISEKSGKNHRQQHEATPTRHHRDKPKTQELRNSNSKKYRPTRWDNHHHTRKKTSRPLWEERTQDDEEVNPPRSTQHCQRFGAAASISSCSATPSGPPSQLTRRSRTLDRNTLDPSTSYLHTYLNKMT